MNKEEEQRRLIACSTTDEPCWVPDSIEKEASCGHKVWMSPASVQNLSDHPESLVMCMECVIEMTREEEVQMIYTAQQLAELRELLPEELIQQTITDLDMKEDH